MNYIFEITNIGSVTTNFKLLVTNILLLVKIQKKMETMKMPRNIDLELYWKVYNFVKTHSYKETAAEFGISEMQISRIKKRIEKRIEKRIVEEPKTEESLKSSETQKSEVEVQGSDPQETKEVNQKPRVSKKKLDKDQLRIRVMTYLIENKDKAEVEKILEKLPQSWGGKLPNGGGWSGAWLMLLEILSEIL